MTPNVFTLGQSLQPVALVFQRVGRVWKLAAIVNQSSGNGHHAWPALCRTGPGTTAPAVLAPAGYVAALARTPDHAATGATETAAAAAPFAMNPFLTGPGSFTAQSATQIRQDHAGRATLTEKFVTTYTAVDPLRSAGGRVALDGFFGWPLSTVAS